MLIGKPAKIPSSEITSESVYLSRRSLLKGLGAVAGVASMPTYALTQPKSSELPLYPGPEWMRPKIDKGRPGWIEPRMDFNKRTAKRIYGFFSYRGLAMAFSKGPQSGA